MSVAVQPVSTSGASAILELPRFLRFRRSGGIKFFCREQQVSCWRSQLGNTPLVFIPMDSSPVREFQIDVSGPPENTGSIIFESSHFAGCTRIPHHYPSYLKSSMIAPTVKSNMGELYAILAGRKAIMTTSIFPSCLRTVAISFRSVVRTQQTHHLRMPHDHSLL